MRRRIARTPAVVRVIGELHGGEHAHPCDEREEDLRARECNLGLPGAPRLSDRAEGQSGRDMTESEQSREHSGRVGGDPGAGRVREARNATGRAGDLVRGPSPGQDDGERDRARDDLGRTTSKQRPTPPVAHARSDGYARAGYSSKPARDRSRAGLVDRGTRVSPSRPPWRSRRCRSCPARGGPCRRSRSCRRRSPRSSRGRGRPCARSCRSR